MLISGIEIAAVVFTVAFVVLSYNTWQLRRRKGSWRAGIRKLVRGNTRRNIKIVLQWMVLSLIILAVVQLYHSGQ